MSLKAPESQTEGPRDQTRGPRGPMEGTKGVGNTAPAQENWICCFCSLKYMFIDALNISFFGTCPSSWPRGTLGSLPLKVWYAGEDLNVLWNWASLDTSSERGHASLLGEMLRDIVLRKGSILETSGTTRKPSTWTAQVDASQLYCSIKLNQQQHQQQSLGMAPDQ